jgi:2'-5' RNA ligase superfamily protein
MPRTALLIPVAEAAAYYDGQPGVPAHLTILFPFPGPDEVDADALADLFGRFPAFDFVLDRIETFEDGTRWLHPVPAAPFVDLTAAVEQRWPDHPPYEGAFDEVIPHMTITVGDVPLPVAGRATEIRWMEKHEDGTWSTIQTFALQGVA